MAFALKRCKRSPSPVFSVFEPIWWPSCSGEEWKEVWGCVGLLQPWDRILAVERGEQSWCVRALLGDVQLKHGAGISLRFSVLKHGLVLCVGMGTMKAGAAPNYVCLQHLVWWGAPCWSVLSDMGSHIPGGSERPPEPRAPWGFCSEHAAMSWG